MEPAGSKVCNAPLGRTGGVVARCTISNPAFRVRITEGSAVVLVSLCRNCDGPIAHRAPVVEP